MVIDSFLALPAMATPRESFTVDTRTMQSTMYRMGTANNSDSVLFFESGARRNDHYAVNNKQYTMRSGVVSTVNLLRTSGEGRRVRMEACDAILLGTMAKQRDEGTPLSGAIRRALVKAGKSQNWLAAKLQLSPPTVSKWVRGESVPYAKNARELLEALGPYGLTREDLPPELANGDAVIESAQFTRINAKDSEELQKMLAEKSQEVVRYRKMEQDARQLADASEADIREILDRLSRR